MRPMKLERVELSWDGQRMSIRSPWESGETLSATDYYSGKRYGQAYGPGRLRRVHDGVYLRTDYS